MTSSSKTVVITGASAGVGRATAVAFGKRSYAVGLIARGRPGLEAARAEVEAAGGRGLVLPADVSEAYAVEAAAERAEAELGPIDVWVNCAMVTSFSPFGEMTPEEYRRITDVTYLGYVFGTMAALKRMRTRNHGTIVQVGSALAYRSIPLQSAYCGAKHAITGFTDSLRSELIHDGSAVRLTMVQLPAVNTPQFNWARNRLPCEPQPVPPVYQPEVAAEAIVQAAQEAPRELWVGKTSVNAILGHMVAPGYLDRQLAHLGYEGQLSKTRATPHRRDNLYEPLPDGHGAHGRFDAIAADRAMGVEGGNVRKILLGVLVGLSLADFLLGYAVGRRGTR